MDPNIDDMKYSDLRVYAKNLGVDINGKAKVNILLLNLLKNKLKSNIVSI
jgi:hypothetical protein